MQQYFFNSTTWQYLTKDELDKLQKTEQILDKIYELLKKEEK